MPHPRLLAALLACAVPVPAGNAAEPADPWRLTREVMPLAQSVELTLDPAGDDYTGRVLIDVVAANSFQSFRLNAEGPVITSATLTDPAGRSTTLTAASTRADLGLVTLSAPSALPAGNYRLTAEFTAGYQRDGLGLYKTVSRGDAYLFTQFEDKHARKAFPCWDEPAFKIYWQLSLTIPVSLEAVANAPVARETRTADTKTLHFGRTPPMPSYLVALAVGPLEFVPVPGQSVPGHIITPRGQSGLTAEAVSMAPPILARLEEYFGIPYPYAKLDQLAVPEYVYGAMENVGLITYTDRYLLMDPARPSFSARRSLANIMAHEMAHMWFGNLVTMEWWDDLWLNEAFADWICAKIVDRQYPGFRFGIQESRAIKGAMRSDTLPSITAVRRKVTSETDLAQLADELTYNKGKGILTMVENWIGPDKFRAAMRVYFQRHSWGSTTADDLWGAFSTISGDNISQMLAAYIEKPGVPLVTFAFESDGRLRLSQRRFTSLGDKPLPGQWQVPVVLAWSKDGRLHRERLLLTEPTQVFAVPGLAGADWIYPNAGEAGYYRWSLPPELNARLARQAAALSPLERVGLLDNISALFSAGQMDGGDYLAYLTASARDEDPDVTESVAGGIGGLRETFVSPAAEPAYDAYRQAILRPVLDRIGLQPAKDEPDYVNPLRATLYGALGTEAADPAVVAECRRLTALYLENPRAVDPSLAGVALSVAAYHGDAALFASFTAALEQARTPSGRSAYIRALNGFRDPALLQRALDYSLTPALNSTEFLRVLLGTRSRSGVGASEDLRDLAVNWMMTHYNAIAAKAPAEYLAGLISVAGTSDENRFNRVRDFLLAPERRTEFAEVTIAKAADRMHTRQRLKAKEQANIEKYLATFPGRTSKD
ncbi:MAG: M1 family metallopeptidase [Opitutaceae bacterium]|nr:M1 family metallopeptidase [Opitutaceae bacterium]